MQLTIQGRRGRKKIIKTVKKMISMSVLCPGWNKQNNREDKGRENLLEGGLKRASHHLGTWVSCTAGKFFTIWATGEAPKREQTWSIQTLILLVLFPMGKRQEGTPGPLLGSALCLICTLRLSQLHPLSWVHQPCKCRPMVVFTP